jgi:hypothetical protein
VLDVLVGILGALGDLLAPTPAVRAFWAVFAVLALIVAGVAISYAIAH